MTNSAAMIKISRPTLYVDEDKCKMNIKSMVQKATDSGVVLRPHFKTHQSKKIGRWFSDEGVKNITVSSIDMARYFSNEFDHITLAIPFNINQINELNDIASQTHIALLVDRAETVTKLSQLLESQIECWIEIDTGSKRTGADPLNVSEIEDTINEINNSEKISFKGFYSHPGHSYNARGIENIKGVYNEALEIMLNLSAQFSSYKPFELNIGDTPGCSTSDSFHELDSISPGNYVFYDLTQIEIGSCDESQIAVCLYAPIISKNSDRLEMAIYGGGIHLSKERLIENDRQHFGKMVEIKTNGWGALIEGCYLRTISQEHGILKVTREIFEKYTIGDTIGILPIHSCMTGDCMGGYSSFSGEKIDHMREHR